MRLARLLPAAILLSAPLLSAPAAAKCAVPSVAFGPPPASAVPEDPTLYLFVPRWQVARLDARARMGDRDLPFTLREVAVSDAWTTFALTVDTPPRGDLVVTAAGEVARFRVDPAWAPPAERRAEPVAAAWKEDRWTCSYSAVWEVMLRGEAAAYQVDLLPGGGGPPVRALFPRSGDLFWPWAERAPEPSVALGHLNCFDWSVPEASVRPPAQLRVTPLYADGRAGEPSAPFALGGPARAEPPASEPEPLAPQAEPDPDARAEPEPEAQAEPDLNAHAEPSAGGLLVPFTAGAAIALISAAVLGLDLAIAARRRRVRRVAVVSLAAAVVIGVLAGLVDRTGHPAWIVLVASAAAALTIASHTIGRGRGR